MMLNLDHGDDKVGELPPSLYQSAGRSRLAKRSASPRRRPPTIRASSSASSRRTHPGEGDRLTKPFHLVVPGLKDVEGFRMLERKDIKVALAGSPDAELETMEKALNADDWSTAELLITTTAR